METAYIYLALSGALTVLLWTPYILSRLFVWGPGAFLNNYPEGFPATEPEVPLWAERSKRVHLNMVETMPAFIAVIVAAGFLAVDSGDTVAMWATVFFYARIAHAAVYSFAIPFLRTPTYLASWLAILMIAAQSLM